MTQLLVYQQIFLSCSCERRYSFDFSRLISWVWLTFSEKFSNTFCESVRWDQNNVWKWRLSMNFVSSYELPSPCRWRSLVIVFFYFLYWIRSIDVLLIWASLRLWEIYFPLVVKHSFLFSRKHTDFALSICDKTSRCWFLNYPLKRADSCITGTMMLLLLKLNGACHN